MKAMHPETDGPPPACFPPAQWALWIKSERSITASGKLPFEPNGFCSVCTSAYQARMIRLGKCRHPDVVFVPDEDGDPLGVRPHKPADSVYNVDSTTTEGAHA